MDAWSAQEHAALEAKAYATNARGVPFRRQND